MGTGTSETVGQPVNTDGTIAVSVKRAVVARVAASELFQKAPRLREFFLYVAECTLQNRLSEVREQAVAERVFCRRPDFQGTQDNIVRAEARNLRKRLESYFAAEGSDEVVVISMPKGGYALAFEPRSPAASLEVYSPPAQPARLGRTAWLFGAGCILFATAALGYLGGRAKLEQQLQIAKPILPFSALFSRNRDSVIVTSDTGFLQIATLAHHPLSLDDY
ncbi:MAG: hypothetical protein ACRD4O_13555, partial [Bryobacteraceae bacterium]